MALNTYHDHAGQAAPLDFCLVPEALFHLNRQQQCADASGALRRGWGIARRADCDFSPSCGSRPLPLRRRLGRTFLIRRCSPFYLGRHQDSGMSQKSGDEFGLSGDHDQRPLMTQSGNGTAPFGCNERHNSLAALHETIRAL